jgi:hypothetical protein
VEDNTEIELELTVEEAETYHIRRMRGSDRSVSEEERGTTAIDQMKQMVTTYK